LFKKEKKEKKNVNIFSKEFFLCLSHYSFQSLKKIVIKYITNPCLGKVS